MSIEQEDNSPDSMSTETALLKHTSQVLPDLPFEILMHIAESAEKKHLANFRLVCKKWKAAATKTFAKFYFTARFHIMSSHSMKALDSIAAHPDFGPCLRTIVISTYPFQAEREKEVEEIKRLRSSQQAFSGTLKRVFGNIKRHRLGVTIGVSTNPTIEFDPEESAFGYKFSTPDDESDFIKAFGLSNPPDPHIYHHSCHSEDAAVVLESMITAAEEAGCTIHGLVVRAYDRNSTTGTLSRMVAQHLLTRSGSALDVEVDGINTFRYSHAQHAKSYLELPYQSFYNLGLIRDREPPIENWLPRLRVSRLRLQDCEFVEDSFMAHESKLLNQHWTTLESIELRDGRMLGDGDWGAILNFLSSLPKLKHCYFSSLFAMFSTPDTDRQKIYTYEVWFPSDDRCIELNGDEVHSKLKDFGACLSAHRTALIAGTADFQTSNTYYRNTVNDIQGEIVGTSEPWYNW